MVLPPSELEIILPAWMQTATGEQSFELIERTNAADQVEISIAKPGAYDPRHAIVDSNGNENVLLMRQIGRVLT